MAAKLKHWVQRLRDGEQAAFLPFYEKVAPGLMRFLMWKTNGDRAISEDILQESFVRFLVSLDRLKSEEEIAIEAYMLQIVKNCLIDKVARAPHRSRPHVQIEDAYDLSSPSAEAKPEKAVELRELGIAMKSLNEKDSEIIWLRDGLGMSHREVATQVGISEQASRQAYVRAKRSLLEELGSRWFPGLGEANATT